MTPEQIDARIAALDAERAALVAQRPLKVIQRYWAPDDPTFLCRVRDDAHTFVFEWEITHDGKPRIVGDGFRRIGE